MRFAENDWREWLHWWRRRVIMLRTAIWYQWHRRDWLERHTPISMCPATSRAA